jgi:RNA-binding protein
MPSKNTSASHNKTAALTAERKKYLRQLGHELKPVVTIAGKGLSENVLKELNRALDDHELIKVKLQVEDKTATLAQLSEQTGATVVQAIGHMALIIRPAAKPNPKLSNLLKTTV